MRSQLGNASKVILRREEIGGFVVPTFTKNVKVGQPPTRSIPQIQTNRQFCSRKFLLCVAATVLTFFIANLLYLLRFERVDNLGAYRIPPETGLLIPSDSVNGGRIARQKQSPARRCRC
jgi:hypothetical protein